jgi:hypothetical protein
MEPVPMISSHLKSTPILGGFLLLVMFAATACGSGEPEFVYSEDHLTSEDYLTAYQPLEGFGCQQSPTHAGDYVRILVSPEALPLYDGMEIPDGAVIAKPQYADANCTEFKAVTSMKKDSAAESGWQWQRVDVEGVVEDTGQVGFCVQCHQGCAANDWACASKE